MLAEAMLHPISGTEYLDRLPRRFRTGHIGPCWDHARACAAKLCHAVAFDGLFRLLKVLVLLLGFDDLFPLPCISHPEPRHLLIFLLDPNDCR